MHIPLELYCLDGHRTSADHANYWRSFLEVIEVCMSVLGISACLKRIKLKKMFFLLLEKDACELSRFCRAHTVSKGKKHEWSQIIYFRSLQQYHHLIHTTAEHSQS
ncbi:U1 [Hyposoter didymator ichnovirus]|nr:U1 [Hyposoter didymator ichnovirus]